MLNLIVLSITTIFIGIFLQKSSKYLSFAYNNVTIEIPMLIIIIAGIIGIFLQFCLIKVAIKNWLQNRRLIKSIRYAKKSFFSLMAGHPLIAERLALRIDNSPPFGWLGLLLAANAAKQQLSLENCNKYINEAEVIAMQYKEMIKDPNELATLGIIKVDLYAIQLEYQKCIFELKKLYKNFPGYTPLLLKLIEMYKTINDWLELIKLLPYIKKSKVYSNYDYHRLELLAYQKRMEQLTLNEDLGIVIKFFKTSPKELRKHKDLILTYVNCLIKFKAYELGEKIIKYNLNDHKYDLDPDLIKLYGIIPTENLAKKIKAAESWLEYNSKDPNLLLVLGKLCMQADLLGKAKNYLDQALDLGETPACYVELGKLAGIMGDNILSLQFYQKAESSREKL